MELDVKVSLKKAYGREMYAPENETAQLFCDLVGAKNLTIDQLRIIRKLGFKVEAVTPDLAGLDE